MLRLGRDPFARMEVRKSKREDGECAWCGRTGRVFYLITEHDGGRTERGDTEFCSMDCARSYYD